MAVAVLSRREERPWALVGLRKMKEVGGRDTMSQGGGEIGEASRGHNPAGPGGWE